MWKNSFFDVERWRCISKMYFEWKNNKNKILTLGLVNGPAKRQSPPKPQLCKKCNCCCDGSSVANIFWMILWMAIKTAWSFDIESTLLIFWSSSEWLNIEKKWKRISSIDRFFLHSFFSIGHQTYITGNTRGKTTEPSAKYWYNTLVSFSSVVYLTSVAKTVNTNACVERSGITSGSSKTFDSFDTDDREPRSCEPIANT